MFSPQNLKQLWENLKAYPWPTITFLAVLMSGWGWMSYTGEVKECKAEIKALNKELMQFQQERMDERARYQQQTIDALNRLTDELTRKDKERAAEEVQRGR